MPNSNNIEELQKLIAQSEKEINEKSSAMDEISKSIELKEKEIALINQAVYKPDTPKIFTREELKLLKIREKEKNRKNLEEERLFIEKETKKAFEEANNIRTGSAQLSPEESRQGEIKALKIEINALEKQISIKKGIKEEKEQLAENLLVKKAVEESRLSEFRKHQLKDKMMLSRSSKIRIEESYFKLKKEIDDANVKIHKASGQLEVKLEKLKTLQNA